MSEDDVVDDGSNAAITCEGDLAMASPAEGIISDPETGDGDAASLADCADAAANATKSGRSVNLARAILTTLAMYKSISVRKRSSVPLSSLKLQRKHTTNAYDCTSTLQ